MKRLPIPSRAEFLQRPDAYQQEIRSLLKENKGPGWCFAIFGQLKIAEIYAGIDKIRHYGFGPEVIELNAASGEQLSTNAHVRRGDHLGGKYIVVRGDPQISRLFDKVFPVSQANTCLENLEPVFYDHAIKKNGAKWFEGIFNEAATEVLYNIFNLVRR